MKNSNVTQIDLNNSGRGTAPGGSLPESINGAQLVGFVIYRPDTDEFLHSHKAGIGYSAAAYCKNPSYAYIFDSERLAHRYSTFLDIQSKVCPVFENENEWLVGFDS